jgi:hypothetical protein
MGDSVHSPGADVSAFLICTWLGLRDDAKAGVSCGDGGCRRCLGSGSIFLKCSVSAFVGAQGDSAV